jgi:hypothetical protein
MDKNLLQQIKFICCNNAKQRRVYYCNINGQPIGTTQKHHCKTKRQREEGEKQKEEESAGEEEWGGALDPDSWRKREGSGGREEVPWA